MFQARALADATVEIYRNDNLFISQGMILGRLPRQDLFMRLVSYILPAHLDQVGETDTPIATQTPTETPIVIPTATVNPTVPKQLRQRVLWHHPQH